MATELLEAADLRSQFRSRNAQRVEDFLDVSGGSPVRGPAGTPPPMPS
jgi:hypothetical protein